MVPNSARSNWNRILEQVSEQEAAPSTERQEYLAKIASSLPADSDSAFGFAWIGRPPGLPQAQMPESLHI
ncbi:MAG TPA: hypothetical protein VMP68_05405 [Candidatus Eisenbacteria bacterium]|nr:hypothetical protein [Candidatus Eisenbacteria bacterium]